MLRASLPREGYKRIVFRASKKTARALATTVSDVSSLKPAWKPPAGPITIDNEQIARLASRPLHPLTLADLVRYVALSKTSPNWNPLWLISYSADMVDLLYQRNSCSHPPISPSHCYLVVSHTASTPFVISPSLWSRTLTLPASITTMSILFRRYYHGRKRQSQI